MTQLEREKQLNDITLAIQDLQVLVTEQGSDSDIKNDEAFRAAFIQARILVEVIKCTMYYRRDIREIEEGNVSADEAKLMQWPTL